VTAGDDSSVTLAWDPTGDDGDVGRPAVYLVHAAQSPLTDATFDIAPVQTVHPAGASGGESQRLMGLVRHARYWFAVQAMDSAGNRSGISNVVSTWVTPLAGRAFTLEPLARPAHAPVELLWQWAAAPPGAAHRIELFDLAGRLRRTLDAGTGTEGSVHWDGRDDDGRRAPAGVYFARFRSAGFETTTRLVLVR